MSSTKVNGREYSDVEYAPGSRVKIAAKYAPYGVAPIGFVFSGTMSLFSESWLPVALYGIPFVVYFLAHQSTRHRFLGDAAWAAMMQLIGLFLALGYPSVIVILTSVFYLLPFSGALTFAVCLLTSACLYTSYYYRENQKAWKDKRTSNLRFALNPDTRTFRLDEGFNFGSINTLRWDDYAVGALLSLSSTGASFLGGLIYESTHYVTLSVLSGVCVPMLLIMLRLVTAPALVTIQKIRKYEKEHDVQIRPR